MKNVPYKRIKKLHPAEKCKQEFFSSFFNCFSDILNFYLETLFGYQ